MKEDYESMQKLGDMEQGVDDHEEGELISQPGQVLRRSKPMKHAHKMACEHKGQFLRID